MTTSVRALALAFLFSLTVLASPAFADVTVFFGGTTTPTTRPAKGFAVGAGLLIVGFEFEYASTSEDTPSAAPALKMGTGSVLLQTPGTIGGIQLYADAGAGGYKETLGSTHDQTSVATSLGGGVKIALAGPVRVRVDYRVFHLGGDALYSPVHRFYAGLNLKF